MKRSTFLILATIVYSGFGLGLLIAPGPFMTVFSVSLDEAGALMARILGSALIGFALVIWWSRNAQDSDLLRAILRGGLIYNAVDLPVVVTAILTGVMGMLGWSAVLLHILLAAGFAYFGLKRR